jgi:hypothetical protein
MDIKPIDLKIHINEMKAAAELLMMDARQLESRANEITKQAYKLENQFCNNLESLKDK